MADLIENPIINSSFEEPKRHFRFNDKGITDEIVPSRQRSTYFIPIAQPKIKRYELSKVTFRYHLGFGCLATLHGAAMALIW